MKNFNKNVFFKNIGKKIFENFKIKIACFVLGVAMFFIIGIFQRSTKTYSCQLKIIGLKDYLVISNRIPRTVKVIARDKGRVFDKITEEDFNVRLDLTKVKNPKKNYMKLEWDIPKTMRSFFSTIKIDPKALYVNLEKKSEKYVDILVNSIGSPAPDYIVKHTIIDPPGIRIQGPESILNKIKSIKTETINIEGVNKSFRRQVDLISAYSIIKILGKADIYFEIIQETDIVSYTFEKVNFQNLKEQFKAKIKGNIVIKISGPKNSIENVAKNDFTLFVDCANIAFPGEYKYEVKTKKPKAFEVISITPDRIEIVVEDK